MASQDIDPTAYGLTPGDVARAAWWIDGHGLKHAGHRAVAQALRASHGRWPAAGRALLTPPLSWAARAGYALVARLRHRLPGSQRATCRR